MTPPKKKRGNTHIQDKIERLYTNYGIDTSTMGEEEFDRLVEEYSRKPENLEADLQKSEEYKDKFSEDLI